MANQDTTIHPLAVSKLPTSYGDFDIHCFESEFESFPTVVLTKDLNMYKGSERGVPLRIHSECMTGDVFGSARCDCGDQLSASLSYLEQNGGLLIYLRQEGRGIGLTNKIKAYTLQEQGYDTIDANLKLGFHQDLRNYTTAIQILNHYEIKRVAILTNNPEKINALTESGIEITERVPIQIPSNPHNEAYLQTKQQKMQHLLDQ